MHQQLIDFPHKSVSACFCIRPHVSLRRLYASESQTGTHGGAAVLGPIRSLEWWAAPRPSFSSVATMWLCHRCLTTGGNKPFAFTHTWNHHLPGHLHRLAEPFTAGLLRPCQLEPSIAGPPHPLLGRLHCLKLRPSSAGPSSSGLGHTLACRREDKAFACI